MEKKIVLCITLLLVILVPYTWSISSKSLNTQTPIKNLSAQGIGKHSDQLSYLEIPIKDTSIQNHPYIHIRELFEKLNFTVEWVMEEDAVLIYKAENFIKLHLDDNYFIFNGELIKHKINPVLYNGKFYVSTDFLSKVFSHFEYDHSGDLLLFKRSEILRPLHKLPSVENKEKLEKLLSYSKQGYHRIAEKDLAPIHALESAKTASDDSNYSGTNVQVRGVDEADIVKTDGTYLYTLNRHTLYIVKSNEDDFRVVSALKYDNYRPIEFYIKDNKLITIGYCYDIILRKTDDHISHKISSRHSNALKIQIYDINDKSNPSLVRNIELDGRYLSSRMIDNHFYLAAHKGIYHDEGNFRPYYKDSAAGSETVYIDYGNIKYFPESIHNHYLMTLGFDVNDLDSSKIDVNAYLGSGNNMYASKENMYITQDKYKYNIYRPNEATDHTAASSIFKFSLTNGKVLYTAKGEVPGTILNQFSMDEHEGNFRIATTKEDPKRDSEFGSANNVYILDENLKLLGETKDLAPGEKIYSVRFMGDKVYVVTFRQVDPFYVIDLKTPSSPKVLGYLKIPGYSSYLHPYDENHIIGIGMDTIEHKGRVTTGGVKISMFDVTDYSSPVELDKVIIGGRGSYTDVTDNHKALLFAKDKNILAFPIYVSNRDKNTYAYTFETQSAFVFSINEDYKFNLRGDISHLEDANNNRSHVNRILFIDDHLYTISDNKIRISDFDTLENIKDLSLEETR